MLENELLGKKFLHEVDSARRDASIGTSLDSGSHRHQSPPTVESPLFPLCSSSLCAHVVFALESLGCASAHSVSVSHTLADEEGDALQQIQDEFGGRIRRACERSSHLLLSVSKEVGILATKLHE